MVKRSGCAAGCAARVASLRWVMIVVSSVCVSVTAIAPTVSALA